MDLRVEIWAGSSLYVRLMQIRKQMQFRSICINRQIQVSQFASLKSTVQLSAATLISVIDAMKILHDAFVSILPS